MRSYRSVWVGLDDGWKGRHTIGFIIWGAAILTVSSSLFFWRMRNIRLYIIFLFIYAFIILKACFPGRFKIEHFSSTSVHVMNGYCCKSGQLLNIHPFINMLHVIYAVALYILLIWLCHEECFHTANLSLKQSQEMLTLGELPSILICISICHSSCWWQREDAVLSWGPSIIRPDRCNHYPADQNCCFISRKNK